MSNWVELRLSEITEINPHEVLKKGVDAKKVPMDKLQPHYRDIPGFIIEPYSGGAKFRNGDTIMARITPCLENGKIAQVNILDENEVGFGSTEYIVFRAKDGIDPDFIYYLVSSSLVKEPAIKSMVGSSGRQRVQTDVVQNLLLKVPELKTQRVISSTLKVLDDKIAENNRINHNLLHQLALTFDQTYVTGRAGTLGELISVIESGSRPRGGAESHGIPSIGAENIEKFGAYDFSKDKYISEQYFASLNRGIVESRDVLLYKDGAYTGKVSMSLDGFPHKKCAVNEHVFILRTLNSRLQFSLYCLMARNDVRNKIYALASSKAAQPGLNQNELRSVPINIPSESELYKFEQYAEPMMHLIAKNANENKLLANLRDLLLPRIMSGEIDVSKVKI